MKWKSNLDTITKNRFGYPKQISYIYDMKIIEKLKDGYIPYKVYEDVELQFKNFVKSVRVLPADFFHEPNEYLTLKAMYSPGEKKTFPNGGFEVYYGDGGHIRNYDLDQVIVHPYVLGIRSFGNTEDNTNIKIVKKENTIPGKKGRKPLSVEEKAKREQEKAVKSSKSNGKKGRPSKYTPEEKADRLALVESKKGGKRGRPSKYTPEEKAVRLAKVEASKGGKRGKPKRI
jgi:hypothetical protein